MERGPLIVLDTHAWIWWTAEPERLSARARAVCETAGSLGVCTISCWEVAMLVEKARLQLDRDALAWIRLALHQPRVRLLALTPEIAVAAARLRCAAIGDPADRMILATADQLGATLVTRDPALLEAAGTAGVW